MTFDPTIDQGYLLEGELLGIYPQQRITDIYEYAAWCRELAERFAELANHYREEATATLAEIRMNQISSNNYELIGVEATRASSDLNAVKLREEKPEIWEKALAIKSSDAVKLIGEDEIRKLIIRKHGKDVWQQNAHPTITNVRKLLPKAEQANYITSWYDVDHYEVRLKALPEGKNAYEEHHCKTCEFRTVEFEGSPEEEEVCELIRTFCNDHIAELCLSVTEEECAHLREHRPTCDKCHAYTSCKYAADGDPVCVCYFSGVKK